MGYRETSFTTPTRPQLTVDGQGYDVDCFGMDDGLSDDPAEAFRFLFQLGMGYLSFLYVIQTGGQGPVRRAAFFHTFWTRESILVSGDEREHGPPSQVSADPIELPLNYPGVTVGGRPFRVTAQRFSAASAAALEMAFELEGGARLLWTREGGWALWERGEGRALRPDERLVFE